MDIYTYKDGCRAGLNTYLRQSLGYLPELKGARLLDAGCGTGVSSCEIAHITDWHITALDLDEASLRVLRQKIARLDIEDRFTVVRGGMEDSGLPGNSFDVILAEGLFNAIGFECGLSLCGAHLKDVGYMIIHDTFEGREEKRRLFKQYGFEVLAEIELDEATWKEKYCACLEKGLAAFTAQTLMTDDEKNLLALMEHEIALFKADPSAFRSVYYIVKRQRESG